MCESIDYLLSNTPSIIVRACKKLRVETRHAIDKNKRCRSIRSQVKRAGNVKRLRWKELGENLLMF